MKIVVVAPQYPPDLLNSHMDGVATYFQQMVLGYRSLGATVTVLTVGRHSSGTERGEFGEDVLRYALPLAGRESARRRLQAVIQAEASLLKLYAQSRRVENVDLLEIPDWLTPLSLPIFARRTFMKLHGPADFIRSLNGACPSLQQRVLDQRARIWAKRVDVLHSGAAVLTAFAQEAWNLDRKIPVTVDPWKVESDAPTAEPIALKFDPETLEIVVIGRQEWRKGQHVVIEALNNLPNDCMERDWRLTLVGRDTNTGPGLSSYRAYCRSVASVEVLRRLRWVEGVPRSHLTTIHANADVTVVASLDGNYGYTTIQALCDGACLVTTLEPGAKSSPYVISGENGILVPAGDADALTRALSRLFRDPGLRHDLRLRARAVRKLVDPAVVASRVLMDAGLS